MNNEFFKKKGKQVKIEEKMVVKPGKSEKIEKRCYSDFL